MGTVESPFMCLYCIRYVSPAQSDNLEGHCAAFPQGIPDSILDNEVDHRLPVSGDNGIRFLARRPQWEQSGKALVTEAIRAHSRPDFGLQDGQPDTPATA